LARRLLIAQNTYPDGGGISSILENLLAALPEDYEVHVAIVEERTGARERLGIPAEQIHVLGYRNAINPVLLPTSLAYAARVGSWLRGVARRVRPQAVVVQDGLNLPIPGLLAARSIKVPLAILDHGTLTNVYEPGWAQMVGRRLSWWKRSAFRVGFVADTPWRAARWRIGVRAADELWFTGTELEPWFGRAGTRARRYAQIVPGDFRPPSPEQRRRAREALGLDPESVVVNMVGRLDGEKGLDTVVSALRSAHMPAGTRFLIAGDGSLREGFAGDVANGALGVRVELLGSLNRPAIRQLHHASDIHLYAGTFSCGISICVLEAMASGVIPVISDVPAAQRTLVGDAGWVFRAGDVSALRGALEEAGGCTPEERSALGLRARERVFTGQEGTPLVELVDGLMSRNDPPRLVG
jgi:glycosyltransferase involved in cell wall biosynthesis